ncbi:MAG: hypothetical protein KDD70_06990 [Bdellovibrionales bacterium]|nr:hypothetical protein [Bdellovibrionales bacterium]
MAFLTQHGKEHLVSPILSEAIGCLVEKAEGFDTDTLGTFTREIARKGTQEQAALRKAKLAAKLARVNCGLGSEGSFGPDPITGLIPWNREVICFFDKRSNLRVFGSSAGPSQHGHGKVKTWTELEDLAQKLSFPSHSLVLRQNEDGYNSRICKGIKDWNTLKQVFNELMALPSTRQLFVENDLRSFGNPSRQHMIQKAAENLAERLCSHCTNCGAPGFWRSEYISGRLCRHCQEPTDSPRAEVWSCVLCSRREARAIPGPNFVDPAECANCNP